jgi:type I restriction enzyme M protein
MPDQIEFVSGLWELVSDLRDFAQPLLQLDVVRCLLFLRYVSCASPTQPRRVTIPVTAQWSHLQSCSHDYAWALSRACKDLERANSWLQGTLADFDFHEVGRSDSGRQDAALQRLIQAISGFRDLDTPSRVGEIYDAFVTRFAESAARSGAGEVFVAIPVARLMADLLELQDGMRVCDPVCRAGRPLTACATVAMERGFNIVPEGQEPSEKLRAICKMNLFLRDAFQAKIELGDVLRAPRLLEEDGQLTQYDRVVTAPPFNAEFWDPADAAQDRWGRFPVAPPKQSADYAYILHCLSTLKEGGRAVILTGRGVLFRQGAEAEIRKLLVRRDHIEAVIGLPGGLLYGTHIPAALLVLRKGARPHPGKVLFVEVRRSGERRARHEALRPEEIDAVATYVRRFEAVPGTSAVVNHHEIDERGWILNPAAYLPQNTPPEALDLERRLEEIRRLEAEHNEAVARVDVLLEQIARDLKIGV